MSRLQSDVVADCVGPSHGSKPDEQDYYAFHPKFANLKLPESDYSDSGFGSVGSSATKSLREEFDNESCSHLSASIQTLRISEEPENSVNIRDTQVDVSQTVGQFEDVDEVIDETEVPETEAENKVSYEAFEQDDDGDTMLHLSIIHNRVDVAEAIIDQAPSSSYLDIHNDLLQKPLHLASILKQSAICRKLILAGATVDVCDRHGATPLHLACAGGDLETVQALTLPISIQELQHQQSLQAFKELRVHQLPQDLEMKNYEGLTCVHLAANGNHVDVLEYLCRLGADVNAGDGKSGRTALHYAVENQNTQLINFLLSTCSAYVDSMTFNGCTPLHLAVGRNYIEGTQLLIQAGADAGLVNIEQESPHDLAVGSTNIGTLLEPTYDDFTINGQPLQY
ncbi:NF-kappa-B inhibitor epsilon-like [Ptychodera flava]|uniref:NF-kappa-B inhibitor epsilon-like n=1 Tax=Ptychodera flava TaxID=63121 RepID=UPI00396A86F5